MSTATGNTSRLGRFGPYLIVVPATTIVGLLGSALMESVTAMVVGAAVGAAWGLFLGFIAHMVRRKESRATTLANLSVFLAVLMAGILAGGSVFDLMQLSMSLDSPTALSALFHSPIFDGPNVFFIIFNTVLESLLAPLALYLNWHIPQRRTLMVVAWLLYYLQRAWTYLYFVPNVYEFTTLSIGEPFSAEVVDRIRLWVQLSWFRTIPDQLLFLCFSRAATVRAAGIAEQLGK